MSIDQSNSVPMEILHSNSVFLSGLPSQSAVANNQSMNVIGVYVPGAISEASGDYDYSKGPEPFGESRNLFALFVLLSKKFLLAVRIPDYSGSGSGDGETDFKPVLYCSALDGIKSEAIIRKYVHLMENIYKNRDLLTQ